MEQLKCCLGETSNNAEIHTSYYFLKKGILIPYILIFIINNKNKLVGTWVLNNENSGFHVKSK